MCPLEIQIHSKEETHEAKPDRERQNQERDAPVSRVTHYPGELPPVCKLPDQIHAVKDQQK
jgi:hypothetical protein